MKKILISVLSLVLMLTIAVSVLGIRVMDSLNDKVPQGSSPSVNLPSTDDGTTDDIPDQDDTPVTEETILSFDLEGKTYSFNPEKQENHFSIPTNNAVEFNCSDGTSPGHFMVNPLDSDSSMYCISFWIDDYTGVFSSDRVFGFVNGLSELDALIFAYRGVNSDGSLGDWKMMQENMFGFELYKGASEFFDDLEFFADVSVPSYLPGDVLDGSFGLRIYFDDSYMVPFDWPINGIVLYAFAIPMEV